LEIASSCSFLGKLHHFHLFLIRAIGPDKLQRQLCSISR
jgi:hypothetical protein